MVVQYYYNRVGFAGGGRQKTDDGLPQYSIAVKQYLVRDKFLVEGDIWTRGASGDLSTIASIGCTRAGPSLL